MEYPDLGAKYFRTKELTAKMKTFLSEHGGDLSAELNPIGSSDVSWGSGQSYKSRTGMVFMFAGGPITQYSGKHIPTAVSSTEVKLHALADAINDVMFVRNVFSECGVIHQTGMIVLGGNMAAINIVGDPKYHVRVNHLGVRRSLIREAMSRKFAMWEWFSTHDMLADILTKGTPSRHILAYEKHWYATVVGSQANFSRSLNGARQRGF
jgi:hypothetical protein